MIAVKAISSHRRIDVMLARRKMAVGTLAQRVGITPANLAVLKNGRAKAVKFSTLAALCEALDCQPGDLLRWEPEDADETGSAHSAPAMGSGVPGLSSGVEGTESAPPMAVSALAKPEGPSET